MEGRVTVLPSIVENTSPAPVLLAQGAEALVYKTYFLNMKQPAVLKYRPPKTWRHPTLDARLTRQRILAEARILVRCRKAGIRVPALLALDWEGRKDGNGKSEGAWMMVEWIRGGTVRAALSAWTKNAPKASYGESASEWKNAINSLMQRIGQAIAKLHAVGLTHGDLTTSNLMLCPSFGENADREQPADSSLEGEIYLIDFGLAVGSVQEEDRAVDLYVLERAFGSTHPTVEHFFEEILRTYGDSYKGAKLVLKRLEDVRQRGRKRSMVG